MPHPADEKLATYAELAKKLRRGELRPPGHLPLRGDPLSRLIEAAHENDREATPLDDWVQACLYAGYTWQDIGPAIGLTVERAQERWGKCRDEDR